MSYFRRGRHRATRHSQPVRELITECQRQYYTLDSFFTMRSRMWGERP